MLVKDIMTTDVVSIDCDKTILDACNKYRERKVGCLLVTENNHVAGIVTERDLIERTICMDRDPKTTKIKEIMTSDVKTIESFERIDKAVDMFKRYNIKKLPVTFNKELVGIITVTDIAYSRPSIKSFISPEKVK